MEKLVRTVFVKPIYVICPFCGKKIKGWMNDPRGTTDTCESCGKEISIDPNATLVMDY